jgi:hypothetical protein
MRELNEHLARQANAEDGCTGRFWEGRFRSQALLDEGALLTCMAYVDLNPIRAGIATTLEGSAFTSIRARLRAATPAPDGATPADTEGAASARLVPFADEARAADPAGAGADSALRLPIARPDYLHLLACTAAAVRAQRDASLPPELTPALERVGLDPAGFIPAVRHFARSFFGMVGEVHRIDTESRRRGYRHRLGLPAAARLYRRPAA